MGSVQEVEETAGMHVLTSVLVFWVEHWRVNERMHTKLHHWIRASTNDDDSCNIQQFPAPRKRWVCFIKKRGSSMSYQWGQQGWPKCHLANISFFHGFDMFWLLILDHSFSFLAAPSLEFLVWVDLLTDNGYFLSLIIAYSPGHITFPHWRFAYGLTLLTLLEALMGPNGYVSHSALLLSSIEHWKQQLLKALEDLNTFYCLNKGRFSRRSMWFLNMNKVGRGRCAAER